MIAVIHLDGAFTKTVHIDALPDVEDFVRIMPPDGGALVGGIVGRREFDEIAEDVPECRERNCTTLVAHIYVRQA